MKIAYIAHPIRGDVMENVRAVEEILKHIFETHPKVYPIAPYLHACMYLKDENPTHRAAAMEINRRIIESGIIDELWIVGKESEGVLQEIQWAVESGITVVFCANAIAQGMAYCKEVDQW